MKAAKRILRIAGLTVALFFVLIVAGAILLHTPPAKNYIRSRAEEYVSRKYIAELKIDRYNFSLLNGSVSAEGVRFRSVSQPGLAPLLHIGKLHVNLDLISTLSGRTAFQLIRLENADIHWIVDKEGNRNVPDFGGGGGGAGLLIKGIEISNSSLRIEDRRQQIAVHLPSWQIQVKDVGTDLSSRIHFDMNEGGTVNYRGSGFDIGNLKIEARASAASLEIQKLSMTAAGSKLEGAGSIRDFSKPVIDLKIDAEIDLERAASVLGSMPGMKGQAMGTIHLTGPLENLQIRGKLQGDITSVRPANASRPPMV